MFLTRNTNWKKLPSSILQSIFHHVRSSRQNPISTLKESTVVCKDWMKPAQQVLYQNVYLDANNIDKFTYTICTRSSGPARYVKKVKFCRGFEILQDTAIKFNMVALFCLNLSEMHGANLTVKQIVWSYLKANKSIPLRLQSFNQQDQRHEALSAIYVDVALKHMETMTQLQVAVNNSGCPLRNPYAELVLASKLPFFKSLESLRVTSFEDNHLFDLNLLIDSCGDKVSDLRFDALGLFLPYTPVYIIRPNSTIKNLTIDYADIPANCLHYLSIKLRSLRNLQITVSLKYSTFKDEMQWWSQLENLCLPLNKYSIRTNSTTLAGAVYVLKRSTSAKVRKLTVSTCYASSPGSLDLDCITSLFKNDTTLELSLKHFYVDNFKLDSISGPLFLYEPTLIKIVSENMDAFYDKYTVRIPQFTPSSATQTMGRYFTPEAVTYKIRRYLARECNDRNWRSFHTATHMVDLFCASSTLHFDRMIFCDAPPTAYQVQRQVIQLTNMYLTNSIIYYKMFYDLSEKLPIIAHLTIDTCSILMEEQYSIRIFLPFTVLGCLRYKVAPFLNATSFTALPNETSNFENDDLLNVVETNGGLIFKIETAHHVYTIRKKGDLYIPVGGTYRHLLSGTQNLFLVWIKCVSLDSLIFDGNGKSSLVWKLRPSCD